METPEFFMGSYDNGESTESFLAEGRNSDQNPTGFTVDDLLDFPYDDDIQVNDGFLDNSNANYTAAHSSTFNSTTTDSCSSSASANVVGYQSFADSHFSSELCVPCDDVAELEWLSNFVEDSFSTDQSLQANFHFLAGSKPPTPESSSSETYTESPVTRNLNNHPNFQHETPLPSKARSKRSRAAPWNWSTRLLETSSEKQEQPNPNPNPRADGVVRKCLHCAAEKTPQWRTGPMGPKTLCNACGVRYKSGRLVPEYRPAASPTFVSARHSNSHRKVLEIRRQKELQMSQQEQFLSQRSNLLSIKWW